MRYILLLLAFIIIYSAKAQTNVLTFNKLFVECEDRWVAFSESKKDSGYIYGFIYLDEQAGLTLNMEGSFKIANNGVFVPTKNTSNIKVRLQANQVRVALIPTSKFDELQIKLIPDWLKYYKTDTTSVKRLVRWGYYYNDFGESAKALTYLEPAQKLDPHYQGLAFELAFAYNALGKYDKAIPILEEAIKLNPKDCNPYQDLAYAQVQLNKLDQAIDIYKAAVEKCEKKNTKSEIAFNIAGHYYRTKEKEQFKLWALETRKWAEPNSKYLINLTQLEQEMAK